MTYTYIIRENFSFNVAYHIYKSKKLNKKKSKWEEEKFFLKELEGEV